MESEKNIMQTEEIHGGIFGVEDMVNSMKNIPLHSTDHIKIDDAGELCDSDCIDGD
ncbi:MAG: hypothetical protein ACYC5G_05975 [Candidatus Doudnabacteria bacterium]